MAVAGATHVVRPAPTHFPMNATAFSSAAAPPADDARQPLSRNALIAVVVVALHVGFIWALQSGLLMPTQEMVVTAEVLSEFVSPPAPKLETVLPVPQLPPPSPTVKKKTVPKAPVQSQPQPQPPALTIADPTPSLDPLTGAVTLPLALSPDPVAETPSPAVAPADQVVMQLPSSNAEYLQNPKPSYPALSARLGETGTVIHKVWIGADGKAQRAELVTSSGFSRLDKAAYETVMRWRYVPGKRNGIAQTMPFNVPISWELRD